jgi:hypothetical protein
VELFPCLRASNTSGPTPPIGLNFNAYVRCATDVDLGAAWCCATGWSSGRGGLQDGGLRQRHFLDHTTGSGNTILFTTDYLPQGDVTPPQDVTVSAGMPASFSTSFWTAPEGESRVEWWRSDNEGVTWSRVRTTIVPIASLRHLHHPGHRRERQQRAHPRAPLRHTAHSHAERKLHRQHIPCGSPCCRA